MEQPPATYQVKGAELRKRRMDLGMSLAECASLAGISRAYLSQLELSHRSHPRPPIYAALRTALSVTDDRFLAEDASTKE